MAAAARLGAGWGEGSSREVGSSHHHQEMTSPFSILSPCSCVGSRWLSTHPHRPRMAHCIEEAERKGVKAMNTISKALLPTKPFLPYSPRCGRNKGSPWPDPQLTTQPGPGSALRILRFLRLLCLNCGFFPLYVHGCKAEVQKERIMSTGKAVMAMGSWLSSLSGTPNLTFPRYPQWCRRRGEGLPAFAGLLPDKADT